MEAGRWPLCLALLERMRSEEVPKKCTEQEDAMKGVSSQRFSLDRCADCNVPTSSQRHRCRTSAFLQLLAPKLSSLVLKEAKGDVTRGSHGVLSFQYGLCERTDADPYAQSSVLVRYCSRTRGRQVCGVFLVRLECAERVP